MRDLINKTDDQIEQAFDEMGALICVEDLVFTRDTIDDFIAGAAGFADHGAIIKDGQTLLIERAQPRKGDVRNDLYVVDFGEIRATFK